MSKFHVTLSSHMTCTICFCKKFTFFACVCMSNGLRHAKDLSKINTACQISSRDISSHIEAFHDQQKHISEWKIADNLNIRSNSRLWEQSICKWSPSKGSYRLSLQIFRSINKEHRHDLEFEMNEDVANSNMPQFLPHCEI